jgi:hypothetical protein
MGKAIAIVRCEAIVFREDRGFYMQRFAGGRVGVVMVVMGVVVGVVVRMIMVVGVIMSVIVGMTRRRIMDGFLGRVHRGRALHRLAFTVDRDFGLRINRATATISTHILISK